MNGCFIKLKVKSTEDNCLIYRLIFKFAYKQSIKSIRAQNTFHREFKGLSNVMYWIQISSIIKWVIFNLKNHLRCWINSTNSIEFKIKSNRTGNLCVWRLQLERKKKWPRPATRTRCHHLCGVSRLWVCGQWTSSPFCPSGNAASAENHLHANLGI